MRVNVVYRAVSGDNAKPRPAWYSKRTALASLLRAWAACPARGELVVLADEGLEDEMPAAVRAAGGVVEPLPKPTPASVARALAVPFERGWPEADLVQHVEDDYLFQPGSLTALSQAAAARPDVDYFALYGFARGWQPNGGGLEDERRTPRGERGPAPLTLPSGSWIPGLSHNATVAVRMPAARRDRRLQWVAPRADAWWDHAVCLAYAGHVPFRLVDGLVREPLDRARESGAAPALRVLGRRLEMFAHAAARRRRPHRLLVARPALITHIEEGYLAQETDWAAVAREADAHEARLLTAAAR